MNTALKLVVLAHVGALGGSQTTRTVGSIVENFYKEYSSYTQRVYSKETNVRLDEWVKASPYLSDGYKKAYKKATDDAKKEDPEIGLGYDPIIMAQDDPQGSFKATNVKIKGRAASVLAVAKGGFKIKIGLIKSKSKWLINRIGDIGGK